MWEGGVGVGVGVGVSLRVCCLGMLCGCEFGFVV